MIRVQQVYKKRWIYAPVLLALASSLMACGGGDSNGGGNEEVDNTPPAVTLLKVSNSPLGRPGAQQVERLIKNGIYAQSIEQMPVLPVAPNDMAAPPSNNFSTTNIIEQGVDESDRIKYDGNYMYVAERSNISTFEATKPKLRVLKRNPDFTLETSAKIESSLDFYRTDGIYLHQNVLAMLGRSEQSYTLDSFQNNAPWIDFTEKVALSVFNVSDPTQPTETTAIEIEGVMLGTRRIGDDLYIISGYLPSVARISSGDSSDEAKQANYAAINNTPISELMPKVYQDGQSRNLNSPEDCYIPTEATSTDGYARLINVTKINLLAPSNIESLCLSSLASLLYMSPKNLYLASDINADSTHFHKVSLSNLDYAASGSVAGQMGWRANPLFRLSENDDKLRVVTTDYSGLDPLHRLFVLEQDGADLNTVAELPNNALPEPIGKPREDIFAVRFIDEKAYIVTFERIDPLYVVNLSDPRNPFIEGALEIPGFSSYIHPMENGFLLGVGQQITPADLPLNGNDITPAVQVLGMKISLFDVRDAANPIELSSIVTPDAYTPVEFNYKALSVLNTNGVYQFALPYEAWGEFPLGDTDQGAYSYQNSLMLLQSDTLSAAPSLEVVQALSVDQDRDVYFYSGDDRSVIHGDKIYYLRGNHVWLSDWAGTTAVQGPF